MITSIPRPRPRLRPRLVVLVGALVAALTAALVGLVGPASAAATPSCGITWGSLAKSGPPASPAGHLTDVRAGRHACYDRLVVDIAGPTTFHGWSVRYVPRVTADPSGFPVPLRGGARLLITLQSPDHTTAGTPTYRPAHRSELVDVSGYRTFRQVAWAGSFEGVSSIGLGVRARLPFRVLTVAGIPGNAHGTRVVLDVAHSW